MATTPSLALIPSGYKGGSSKGTLYSVVPADGTGDFDFTRSGSATRINKEGLIETVGNNVPRLNYPLIDGVVSGCPSLLLEPSRTNNVFYSQEVNNDYWIKSNCIITPNTHISPDGTLNADTLTSSAGNAVLYRTSVIAGSLSFFAKDINLTIGNFVISVDNIGSANWDKNGNLVSVSGGTASNGVDYGNGWFRFSYNVTSGSVVNYGISNGSGNESILVFGLQNEPSSLYSTSYIPTQGSIGTRVAESCNQTPPSGIIGQTEGTIYIQLGEINSESIDDIYVELNNGSGSVQRIGIYVDGNSFLRNLISGGGDSSNIQTNYTPQSNDKIAITYKTNEAKIFVNGIQRGVTDTTVGVPATTRFSLQSNTSIRTESNSLRDVKLYNTALTDQELINLTKI